MRDGCGNIAFGFFLEKKKKIKKIKKKGKRKDLKKKIAWTVFKFVTEIGNF